MNLGGDSAARGAARAKGMQAADEHNQPIKLRIKVNTHEQGLALMNL